METIVRMGYENLLTAGIQALIFDCDGTLVDTPAVYAKAWGEALGHYGLRMEGNWYLARAGMSAQTLLEAYEAEFDVQLDRPGVVRIMRNSFSENMHQLCEITPVANIARHFHGRLPMAVASGGAAQGVLATLKATNLHWLFDTVVTIEDVTCPKPSPDLFLEAAARLSIVPGKCLVFEDSREGLEAARQAGMPVVDIAEIVTPLKN